MHLNLTDPRLIARRRRQVCSKLNSIPIRAMGHFSQEHIFDAQRRVHDAWRKRSKPAYRR